MARAEKALLDLIYLEPVGEKPPYLWGLRLQNLPSLDLELMKAMAERSRKPKLMRAVATIAQLAERESQEYEAL